MIRKASILSILMILCFFSNGLYALESELPQINVVFLDLSTHLPDGSSSVVVRNDWDVWNKRLSTFLPLLKDVAAFKQGEYGKYQSDASQFSILLPNTLSDDKRKELLIRELTEIDRVTKRPSCILTRSSAGVDQLSVVFQDGRDYPPQDVAEIILQFAHLGPAGNVILWPNNLGPFQAPPTLIMDFSPGAGLDPDKSPNRWALLETGYLLREYVLHMIAVLNNGIYKETATFYEHSSPVGSKIVIAEISKTTMGDRITADIIKSETRGGRVDFVTIKSDHDRFVVGRGPGTVKFPTTMTKEELSTFVVKRADKSGYDTTFFKALDSTSLLAVADSFKGSRYTTILGGHGAGSLGDGTFKSVAKEKGLKYDEPSITRKSWEHTKTTIGLVPVTVGLTIAGTGSSVPVSFPTGSVEWTPKEYTKPVGGILFEVENRYEIDTSGEIKHFSKLAKEAKEGTFTAEGKEYKVAILRIPQPSPLGSGACKLVEVDMLSTLSGHLPLAIPRFYNSSSKEEGTLGRGWTTEFAKIELASGEFTTVELEGKQIELPAKATFVEQETGAKLFYTLSESYAIKVGDLILYNPVHSMFQPEFAAYKGGDYYEILLEHGTSIRFNKNGKPIQLSDRRGNVVKLTYEDVKLTEMVDLEGKKKFVLRYNDGRLTQVRDNTNTSVNYAYDTQKHLSTVQQKYVNREYKYSQKGILCFANSSNYFHPLEVLYGGEGDRVEKIRREGNWWELSYDDKTRKVTQQFKNDKRVQWNFNLKDYLISIFDGLNEIFFTRDRTGRVLQLAWGKREEVKGKEIISIHKVIGASGASM